MGMKVASAAGPLEDLFYNGKVTAFYGRTATKQHREILEQFKETRLAENLAETVQRTVRLKHNLAVGFAACGRPNAFYDSKRYTIIFCLELFELIAKQVSEDPDLSQPARASASRTVVVGAVYGIFLHELGHAVLDINRVPVTGREEDVADQFSLFYATKVLEPRGVQVVLPTVWFFRSMAQRHDLGSEEVRNRVMSDEHSLDEQRIYNLACWTLGTGTESGAKVAKYVNLPETRSRQCPNEYARLDDAMKRLFGKYLAFR